MDLIRIDTLNHGEVDSCIAIDREIDEQFAWSKRQWERINQRESVVLLAAKHRGVIVGVIAFEVFTRRVNVYRLLVCPWNRMFGVGSRLLRSACLKCRSRSLVIDVREDNLDAQRFLASNGLKGQLKVKPPKTRDGWRVPETIGQSWLVRFTMTAQEVKDECKKHALAGQ